MVRQHDQGHRRRQRVQVVQHVALQGGRHLLPLTHPHLGRVITRFLAPLGSA